MTNVQIAVRLRRKAGMDFIQLPFQIVLYIAVDKIPRCAKAAAVFHVFFFRHIVPPVFFLILLSISHRPRAFGRNINCPAGCLKTGIFIIHICDKLKSCSDPENLSVNKIYADCTVRFFGRQGAFLQAYRVVRQGKATKTAGKDEAGCVQIIYG